MEPWYNVFSYWGFLLWLFSPFPVLSILILNLIGTFMFLAIAKPSLQVALFLILLHVVPVWFARKQPLQWLPALAVFAMYTLFLAIQGRDFASVYGSLLREPPVTIRDYLEFRKIVW